MTVALEKAAPSSTNTFNAASYTEPDGEAQLVKVMHGAEGAGLVTSTANPLPVTIQGGATSAAQATGNASLASIDGKLTGVATAAAQATGNASLASVDGKLADVATGTKQDALQTAFGARNDAAAASDAGVFSLIALIKRMLGKVAALGQATAANSHPVVIASDQSALPVTGGLTDAQLRASAVSVSVAGSVEIANDSGNPLPISGTVLDAINTDLGAPADAAAGSDTGAASITALIKRALQNWTTLLSRLPASLGSKSSAASFPVTMSDDFTVVGTAGLSAINTDLLTATVNGWFDAGSFQSGSIQVVASAGISAGAIIFEQTNDTGLAAAGVPLRAFEASSVNTNPIVAAVAIAASTARVWTVPVNSRFIRVRISTAFVGGTVQAVATLSQRAASFPVVNIQQATAANLNATVSGTVTANIGTGSIAAGTNAIGDAGIQYRASATGAASGGHLVSAATTNATIVKASAGRVVGWHLANNSAAWRYVKLHNLATTPTAGASVARTIGIPPGGVAQGQFPGGIAFTTGIGLTTVTGAADADVTAVGANEIVGDLFFA